MRKECQAQPMERESLELGRRKTTSYGFSLAMVSGVAGIETSATSMLDELGRGPW
jgi:hypothetical protein